MQQNYGAPFHICFSDTGKYYCYFTIDKILLQLLKAKVKIILAALLSIRNGLG